MRITNRNNLPAPLVAAVSQQRQPAPERISVTELIGPPQIRRLQLEHWEDISEDASDRIWATLGSLMHQLLEGHAGEGHRVEETLSTLVGSTIVTGTFDLYHESGTLTDYKFVSVWTTSDGIKPEWEQQLNLYAELLRRSGREVRSLQIVALYRDWSKTRSFEHGYPPAQVAIFDVPLWTPEACAQFLAGRVSVHTAAEVAECTPEERWERPTKYAVMKHGQKRALKLYDRSQDAEHHAGAGAGLYVETRPGMSVRCESYCRVAAFCPQFARLKQNGGGEG
jgi:hypothetical protein